MFFSHTDATVGELSLVRTFNTARISLAGRFGAFGRGWNMSFETRLRIITARIIEVRHGNGEPIVYQDSAGLGVYPAVFPTSSESWLETIAGGYKRVFRAGGYETYDSSGRMLTSVDAGGIATTYTRDTQGRLVQVERLGRALQISYEASDTKPSQVRGPDGTLLASYLYTPAGRLDQVSYADGSGYWYAYDSSGRVTLVTDLAEKVVEAHQYDGSGRASTSEIGEGREKYALSYGTNQTTVTDALGNVTVYDFATVDHMPRVTKVTGPCISCGGGGDVQEWTYDAVGNVTSYKDGAGKLWTYVYNGTNDLTSETDTLGRVTSYTYDSEGRVLTRTAPGEGTTTTTHGPAGPLTITDAINRITSIAYNALGKPQTVTDPRNKVTTLAYNSNGDLISVSDPLNRATVFGYDAKGRRTTVTDALSQTTTTAYNGNGRVTRITNHDGTYTSFGYDKGGRRTKVTDPLGRTTNYLHDLFGRLEAVVDPMNGATKYSYDIMSNLVFLTDAKGQTTTFEYDGQSRVKKVIYPGGAQETFTYDTAGRLKTKTDRKAVVTTFSYDDVGRLTGKSYSDGTTPAVTYTYDTAGRLATAANGTDTLTWAYDLAGQLLSEQSTKNASTVAYTYDIAGNRLSISLDGTLFVSYAYDDASRLTTITRGSNVFGFGYDNANRRTSMTYPNGVNTSYSYDNLNRLLNLSATKAPSTTITNFTYTYDAAGNRLTKQQPDYTESYKYDPLYRLTGVERTGSLTGIQTFRYDAVGNRLTNQKDGAVTTSSYNEKNQLTSSAGGGQMLWRGSLDEPGNVSFTSALVNGKPARMLPGNVFEALLPMTTGSNTVTIQATDTTGNVATKSYSVNVTGEGASYSYDANGNLSQKVEGADTWTYTWNAENQLTKVSKNSVEQARFAYDPSGRRVEKVASGVSTNYTYDAEDVLKLSGASMLKYVHGHGVDEPLASDNGSALVFLHADGLSSIVSSTTSAGAVVDTIRYDAWGQVEAGAPNSYAFTGREHEAETGLAYLRARYYDTKLGRFISEDPIGFEAGIDFFSYVDNNPANLIDPHGLGAVPPTSVYDPRTIGQSPCAPGTACIGPMPPAVTLSTFCAVPCKPRFHWDIYLGCVGTTLTQGGTFAVFGACIGAGRALGPVAAYVCSFAPFIAARVQCEKLAWFCDAQGPGNFPNFNKSSAGRPPALPPPGPYVPPPVR